MKEKINIDKRQWNEILNISRKQLLKVFFAGAVTASVVWILVFYIFIKTGFIW